MISFNEDARMISGIVRMSMMVLVVAVCFIATKGSEGLNSTNNVNLERKESILETTETFVEI